MKAKNVLDSWPINEPEADMKAFLENVSFIKISENTCLQHTKHTCETSIFRFFFFKQLIIVLGIIIIIYSRQMEINQHTNYSLWM